MVSPFFCVLLLGGSLLFSSCQADTRESQAEFAKLSRGIELLRDAENSAKSSQLSELERIECKHHCQLKQLCTSAYAIHIAGLQKLSEARRLVEGSQKDDAHALSLLAAAELQLNAARPQTTACAATENAVERALFRK